MGYQEVFEDDAGRRHIYGAHPHESRSAWIMILDYLLDKAVDQAQINHLNLLYTKWNLGAKVPTVPNQLDGNIAFWSVGGTTPTTGPEVLAMNQISLVGGKFSFPTTDTEIKFTVALPPVRTLSNVEDLTVGALDIFNQYPLVGTVSVDVGGVLYDYKIYEMNNAIPYTISHIHEITV